MTGAGEAVASPTAASGAHVRPDAASPWAVMLGATGVVFGDIGTSPLYAFRESFIGHHRLPLDAFHVLGVLSMLLWALILVVTVKYVFVTMRADNRGEGGSFALLALIERVAKTSPALPYLALAALGATALFYGDAVLTPAISILSAIEGLSLLGDDFTRFVIPVTLVLVVALFAVQRQGTGAIGRYFGPVMLVWFLTIGLLGAWQVAGNPAVLAALNPTVALGFLINDPVRAFFTLGTVVLAVTGAEALYADMGHFGRRAIARAWLWLAFPSLMLCYAGQSALVLADPSAIRSPFYLLAPPVLLIPLLILATAATIIASQSIISGAFSVTQQAVQLGYLPRVRILHTSHEARGQVFAPTVNVLLAVAVVLLVIGFGSSTELAAAFGLTVTATMVLTTLMIGFVVLRVWEWNRLWSVPLLGLLLAVDLGLFGAAATKFMDGGWLPAGIAIVMMLVFSTWRRGRTLLVKQLQSETMPIELCLETIGHVHRVHGTAVYLTSDPVGVPPALLHNLKANKVLHERMLLVTAQAALIPYVDPAERIREEEIGPGMERIIVRYGFAETPDIPAALALVANPPPPMGTFYFLSRQTLVPTRKPGMMLWREHLFAAMVRNAETPMSFFRLPVNRVVELGSQVEI
ncbi:KUP/HAK/KT family potassium transporter [Sphingosinicella sp. LHD-64]|uniref:potassium transporter Kup n=1 Tax=Sphingosinicella sp. LHD-64 TaxID=3072139 RepID=UPI00280D6068|nr:KUP/HAK/KT family potassium transporter [Sphingosinicella sp. LHD-64]MDQ8757975.1 KUP/HAK/KT family potassium transporter [Sphingosinicella sp. LHD-64]